MRVRVGQGFDAHSLASGRRLMLGGVEVPYERGLVGHSDGDCLIHAVCDALLGAAALGDMGRHFPSSDARFKDAQSSLFLSETARLVASAGFALGNLDATLIAQAPPLARYFTAMRDSLAGLLDVSPDLISIKAKSTDGLGALGRGEGIAAQAVVLLFGKEDPR